MEQLLDKIAKAPPLIKFGGVAGALVLVTALNFFFMIQPTEEAIERLASEQRQADLQYAEKREIAQNLNDRRREMDVLEQKLAEALTELPERSDIEELLAQLNDIGRKSGLEISSVEPGAEAPEQFFARIPVRMSVSGNYHEIAMFLQEISNMRRIVNVTDIELADPVTRNDKVVLKANFLATTFRFLEQPAKAGEKR